MNRNYFLIFFLALVLFFLGCQTSGTSSKTSLQIQNRYTKYNIHIMNTGKDIKAHYTNWIGPFSGHSIVPLNTIVTVKKWTKGFILQRVDTGRDIYFSFNNKHMKMSVDEYVNLITSNKKVSISHLSEIDKKGIKNGMAYVAMTKEGIITALGYPAKHKTPSLKNKHWIYWKNKFITKIIKFNNEGKVVSIVE
ncbi:MAG: hypothetical protein GY707_00115 [Desulfobacteraceae bacterium]|nr:hypothetical protein [Desulfobacteraceae bacterium]